MPDRTFGDPNPARPEADVVPNTGGYPSWFQFFMNQAGMTPDDASRLWELYGQRPDPEYAQEITDDRDPTRNQPPQNTYDGVTGIPKGSGAERTGQDGTQTQQTNQFGLPPMPTAPPAGQTADSGRWLATRRPGQAAYWYWRPAPVRQAVTPPIIPPVVDQAGPDISGENLQVPDEPPPPPPPADPYDRVAQPTPSNLSLGMSASTFAPQYDPTGTSRSQQWPPRRPRIQPRIQGPAEPGPNQRAPFRKPGLGGGVLP